MCSLIKCLFRSFVHFLTEHNCSVLIQLLNCKSSLYILDTISLSDVLLQLSSPSDILFHFCNNVFKNLFQIDMQQNVFEEQMFLILINPMYQFFFFYNLYSLHLLSKSLPNSK